MSRPATSPLAAVWRGQRRKGFNADEGRRCTRIHADAPVRLVALADCRAVAAHLDASAWLYLRASACIFLYLRLESCFATLRRHSRCAAIPNPCPGRRRPPGEQARSKSALRPTEIKPDSRGTRPAMTVGPRVPESRSFGRLVLAQRIGVGVHAVGQCLGIGKLIRAPEAQL